MARVADVHAASNIGRVEMSGRERERRGEVERVEERAKASDWLEQWKATQRKSQSGLAADARYCAAISSSSEPPSYEGEVERQLANEREAHEAERRRMDELAEEMNGGEGVGLTGDWSPELAVGDVHGDLGVRVVEESQMEEATPLGGGVTVTERRNCRSMRSRDSERSSRLVSNDN